MTVGEFNRFLEEPEIAKLEFKTAKSEFSLRGASRKLRRHRERRGRAFDFRRNGRPPASGDWLAGISKQRSI